MLAGESFGFYNWETHSYDLVSHLRKKAYQITTYLNVGTSGGVTLYSNVFYLIFLITVFDGI